MAISFVMYAVQEISRNKESGQKRHNGNVHRAAAKIIVSKSRAARGSVCNVLLCYGSVLCQLRSITAYENAIIPDRFNTTFSSLLSIYQRIKFTFAR